MDIRYAGQGYENPVPVDSFPISSDDLPKYRNRFDEIHRDCHGHAAPGQPCEVVNYRVQAAGKLPPLKLTPIQDANGPVNESQISERSALFSSLSPQPIKVPVYAREKLMAGHRINGPAIVEQYDSTIVIWPEQDALVDKFGNLVVTLRDK
jgi:N-methylhydantoinase A